MDKDIKEILESLSQDEILACRARMEKRSATSTAAAYIVKAIDNHILDKE
tara:strand:+ start:98 stop:247 length:150 start_codon:yes stop_codon:yes gene_type:complete